MGSAYYIVLDQPDVDADVNGKWLAAEGRRLDRLAKSTNVRPLGDFVSMSAEDLEAAADDFGVELDGPAPEEQWFTASEGIDWLSAMRDAILANPAALKNPQAVLADLVEYEQVLTHAHHAEAKWHLAVDY